MNINFIIKFAIQKFKLMLQIPVKEGESIEKALKKYKKKFERTGVLKELRTRKEYIKKSVVRRQEVIKAQKLIKNHLVSS